jgi:hypothetical protein
VGECERKGVQERGKLEEVVKGVAHTVILRKVQKALYVQTL